MPAFPRHALLAAALVLLPATTSAARAEPPVPELALSAEGVARAAPDTAVVTLGVTEQAGSAAAALSANNAAMKATLDTLKAAGIAERDLGTSQFSIEPITVYPEPKADGTREPPRVVGYRVSNELTVRIRDVAKAGDLLDKVVRVGANNVRSVSFAVEDQDALLDEARAAAMAAVRARADLYAKAGGFRLKRILSVSENAEPAFERAPMKLMALAAAPAADEVPLAAGEQRLAVTVNVTWEIAPQEP